MRLLLPALVCLTVLTCYFPALAGPGAAAPSEVFLEDMTWPEVRDALGAGKTTILIPTGGTEQNGPHMVLGKHNYIVRYTAEKIALKLGNALVAPVMAYVPEGQITPPEGHMRFAGTISLRPESFAAVLEDTARSFKQHGFTRICFIGEHGESQKVQQEVTDRLNAEWKDTGVKVIHIGDYYSEKNGQREWLKMQGYKDEEINGHAALSDSAELYFALKEGIRPGKMLGAAGDGTTGASNHATPVIGEKLLSMKIDAAVKQIEAESK